MDVDTWLYDRDGERIPLYAGKVVSRSPRGEPLKARLERMARTARIVQPLRSDASVLVPDRFGARFVDPREHDVTIEVAVADGVPSVVTLTIGRNAARASLDTPGEVRRVQVGALLDRACREVAIRVGESGGMRYLDAGEHRDVEQTVKLARRRRASTPDRLAEVARIYKAADRAPTKAVAVALHLNHSGAAKLVSKARQAGLLPATTQGRARAQED